MRIINTINWEYNLYIAFVNKYTHKSNKSNKKWYLKLGRSWFRSAIYVHKPFISNIFISSGFWKFELFRFSMLNSNQATHNFDIRAQGWNWEISQSLNLFDNKYIICISVRSTIERYKKASASTSGTAPVIDVNSHVRIVSIVLSIFLNINIVFVNFWMIHFIFCSLEFSQLYFQQEAAKLHQQIQTLQNSNK